MKLRRKIHLLTRSRNPRHAREGARAFSSIPAATRTGDASISRLLALPLHYSAARPHPSALGESSTLTFVRAAHHGSCCCCSRFCCTATTPPATRTPSNLDSSSPASHRRRRRAHARRRRRPPHHPPAARRRRRRQSETPLMPLETPFMPLQTPLMPLETVEVGLGVGPRSAAFSVSAITHRNETRSSRGRLLRLARCCGSPGAALLGE